MTTVAYDKITERIIAALEAGTVPWRRPWKGGDYAARNGLSGRRYSGVNVFSLALSGFEDPRWVTFRQALAAGGAVRKGEHGTPVVFWRFLEPKEQPKEGERYRKIPMLRVFTVFNVTQCDGLDAEKLSPWAQDDDNPFTPEQEADGIAQRFFQAAGAPRLSHDGRDRAFYVPAQDHIHTPKPERFDSAAHYYHTLFHEASHATGHKSRLDRHGMETGIGPFGSEVYSREELAAEFGAAFVAAEAGLDNSLTDNSAAYIASWLKALKSDHRFAVVAAGQGQKAADYILDSGDADEDEGDVE